MTEKLIPSLIDPCLDDILSIREEIGADLAKVRLITRTWTGEEIGDGVYSDIAEEMHPAPRVVDLSHSYRALEGGVFKQGDLVLKSISKNKYPEQSMIDCSGGSKTVRKFYEVNGQLYTVISVRERYVTWHVHVRKVSDQTRRSVVP